MQKAEFYLKKPIVIFSCAAVICGLIILIFTKFHLPDFYLDKDSAFNTAQLVTPAQVGDATLKFESVSHKIWNGFYKIFAWLVVFLLFSMIFRLKSFNDIKDIRIFQNKKFIYTWINISYVLYAVIYTISYMIDLDKYVYNSYADTMGIPFFNIIFTFIYLGIFYYAFINLLFFVVYNTKIKSRFYSFICWALIILILLNIAFDFSMIFTYFDFGLDLIYLIWIFVLLGAVRRMIDKRDFPCG